MLNQEKFITRLHKIFDHYGLTAATFADAINVQRSSISHLLSGRNKPSLEFVLKIESNYPEVSLEWLLHGKGSFPKETIRENKELNLFQNTAKEPKTTNTQNTVAQKKTTPSAIDKIVIFYTDGTFKDYSEA